MLRTNWYLLYTAARAEKQVEERLTKAGIEVFLPLHLTPRKWSDRIKMVEVPLFTSYIFVRTSDEILRTLPAQPGISRIVFQNGKPAIVRQKEIDNIVAFLEKARGKECEFVVNEEVTIVAGPMKEVRGRVKKVNRGYLVLTLEQIGVTVRVKMEQVVKKF